MITFKQFISEIKLETPKFEVVSLTNSLYIAKTTIENHKFNFTATFTGDDEARIIFSDVTTGLSNQRITGSGLQFKVAGFVVGALKDFIEKFDPKTILFTADEEESKSRAKVYERLIRQKFPQFNVETRSQDGDMFFELTKKEELTEQLLQEIADKKIDYTVVTVNRLVFSAIATIGNRKIKFSAVDTESDTEGWDIGFSEMKLDGSGKTYMATGSGKEFEVAAAVIAMMREFVDRYDPWMITFSAKQEKETSNRNARAEVYKRLLARHFPEFEVEVDDRPHIKNSMFTMARKIQKIQKRNLEEQLLAESAVQGMFYAFQRAKLYFSNLKDAKTTRKELSDKDGKKSSDHTIVAGESIRLRKEVKQLYDAASPKVKAAIDKLLKNRKVPSLSSDITVSRNYFNDFLALSTAHTILTAKASKGAKEIIIDQVVEWALNLLATGLGTVVTQAMMIKAGIEMSDKIAARINSLKEA